MLSQRSPKLSSFLKNYFSYSDCLISTSLSSRPLTHSFVLANMVLISSHVYFISVLVFRSAWFSAILSLC